MTITYSCIANGRAVLAELALTGGSYQVPLGPDLRLGGFRASKLVPAGPPLRARRCRAAGSEPWGREAPPRERPASGRR